MFNAFPFLQDFENVEDATKSLVISGWSIPLGLQYLYM